MATSNSVNFIVTRDDIIKESLQLVGAIEEGGTPTTNQLADCSRTLNMLVKYWAADGLKVWVNEELVIFPVKDQRQYTFGASGDRMCRESELITTKLNGAVSNTATEIVVDSTAGMAGSDVIGVVTTANDIHFTTISSVDDATTLTLAAGVDADCADNNRVYTFTTAFTQKVLKINNAWVRSTEETDIPINIISREEYTSLSSKYENGRVNQMFFNPGVDTSLINVWPVPNDSNTNERIYAYVTRLYEDFDAAGNNPDYPQEWYLPLAWNLAVSIAPKYGVSGTRLTELATLGGAMKRNVDSWSVEQTSIYLKPARHH